MRAIQITSLVYVMKGRLWLGLLAVLLGVCVAAMQPVMAAGDTHPQSGLDIREVTLVSSDGAVFVFSLEIAKTAKARRTGLMWREQLQPKGGMLFIWPVSAPRAFWMKDTPLSLDILFFDAAGQLLNAHRDTTPFSLQSLPSQGPARYVVELVAGSVQAHDLGPGSQLVLEKWME